MDKSRLIEELSTEAVAGASPGDALSLFFNKQGYEKFRHRLPEGTGSGIPVYTIPVTNIHYGQFVANLGTLMPLIKGYALSLVSPQKRRRLVAFLNETVTQYIGHVEIDNTASIISELTANAEKSNFERLIEAHALAPAGGVGEVLRKERERLIELAAREGKVVQIIWKFSPQIYKVEVKNNTIIADYALDSIRDKMGSQLSSIAEGFTGEVVDKLGAGLGLYFVNFFSDEMKQKYGFETIFRIFNTETNTSASLTVFFEKPEV